MINVHPEFTAHKGYWDKMRVCIEGESAVKDAGVAYLKMTSGMKSDTVNGPILYDAYKARAVYYNFPEETAKAMLGLMQRNDAVIEVPAKMEPLQTQATPDGLNLQTLLREINRWQIAEGRVGILIDVVDGGTSQDLPYCAIYRASAIANWDSKFVNGDEVLSFLVLDESGLVLEDMSWKEVKSFRVLYLNPEGKYGVYVVDEEDQITLTPDEESMGVIFPEYSGKTLDYIPFVFANVTNTLSSCEKPPLLDLADLSLSTYRQEADYRQALFMHGQSTPYAKGVTEAEIDNFLLGASSLIHTEKTEAEFGFLETSGSGLSELRQAVMNLKESCIRLGVSFIEQGGNESGKALETRLSTKTANMKTIASTGKDAMEQIIEIISDWTSAGGEYSVEPNFDFADDNVTASDFVQLMQAKMLGAPISMESIHAWAMERGFTSEEFEVEMARIEEEGIPLGPQDPPPDDNQGQ